MSSGQIVNRNTAVGRNALKRVRRHPRRSHNNTAVGANTLRNLVHANENTAVGAYALYYNENGENTAIGSFSGEYVAGTRNTSLGAWTERFLLGANDNVAIGFRTMSGANEGEPETEPEHTYGNPERNTAVGAFSLRFIKDGNDNVAVGYHTGGSIINQDCNTLVGTCADVIGANIVCSSAIGVNAKVSRSNSLVLGRSVDAERKVYDYVGIGTTAPQASLHVEGGHVNKVVHTSQTHYPVTADDYVIVVAGATNAITLPGDVDDGQTIPGHTFIIKNSTANNVSVTASHDTVIRDQLNIVDPLILTPGMSVTLIHDYNNVTPTEYQVVSKY